MAGLVMTSLLKWTADKLSSLILQRRQSSSWAGEPSSSAEEELKELRNTMVWIHAVLDEAEERDISDKSKQLRLRELKEVSYDAEDVVDEYEYQVLQAKLEARREATSNLVDGKNDKEVSDLNSYHPKVSIPYNLALRVKEIRHNFEEITREWKLLNLRERDGKRLCVKKWMPKETTSRFNETTIFGREKENNRVIEWLLQEEDGHNRLGLWVLPIVGMGGIGKTTLAQIVYNDTKVQKHFASKGWVCVSEEFDITHLTQRICVSLSKGISYNNMNLHKLLETLKEDLKGKEFFLVLDDVWNQNINLWDSLRTLLNGVGVGKIIVTTRNDSVAEIMKTTTPIHLSQLSFDDCLLLFEKIAFEGQGRNSYSNLLDIGKRIVKKCDGLPLAVKVLASIMRAEDDVEEWVDIIENELSELENENNHILAALRLSYDRMPIELRPCFMYLSLFPKDSLLHKKTIIDQWMSQGFLHAKGQMMQEDVGNDYFNELLQRSLVEKDPEYENFIMHDLIHDMAQSVARDEYMQITTSELYPISKTIRHVLVHVGRNCGKINLRPLLKTQHLRTFIVEGVHGTSINDVSISSFLYPLNELLDNLRCLRTLILCIKDDMNLSEVIGKLKHLRYLKVCVVPKSVYKLYHLQTLDIRGMTLSRDVGSLINLRNLYGHRENYLPLEVGGLTNLQKLTCFHVATDDSQCKLRHLKGLGSIRGYLQVTGLENVSRSDVTPGDAILRTSSRIKELELIWSGNGPKYKVCGYEELAQEVLDCLRPHPNLTELDIVEYPGATLPSWLGDASFTKLKKVSLRGSNCMSLPTLGQLPTLKVVVIEEMKRVKSVGHEFFLLDSTYLNPESAAVVATKTCRSCFSSLEELTFVEMDEWEEWLGVEDGDFPCLSQFRIEYCPKLRSLPVLFSSLAKLEISNCHELRSLPPPLSSLARLKISNCGELRNLPPLPSLTYLMIRKCFKLRRLPLLSSLLRLKIFKCCKLRSLIDKCAEPRKVPSLSSLVHLHISRCSKLRRLPSLPSLVELIIRHCSQLSSLPASSPLDTLKISKCCKLRSLPSVTSLTKLVITRCSMLRRLPSLSSLVQLKISKCLQLRRLPSFPCLAQLEIKKCSTLRSLTISLPSLCKLKIRNCRRLGSLPSLWSLNELFLQGECNLNVLRDSCLPVLRCLTIHEYSGACLSIPDCPNMHAIKELVISCCWILTSVQGLDKLASLQRFTIRYCSQLQVLLNEHLPSDLVDVEIIGSAGAGKHVLGSSDSQLQMDSETEQEKPSLGNDEANDTGSKELDEEENNDESMLLDSNNDDDAESESCEEEDLDQEENDEQLLDFKSEKCGESCGKEDDNDSGSEASCEEELDEEDNDEQMFESGTESSEELIGKDDDDEYETESSEERYYESTESEKSEEYLLRKQKFVRTCVL